MTYTENYVHFQILNQQTIGYVGGCTFLAGSTVEENTDFDICLFSTKFFGTLKQKH